MNILEIYKRFPTEDDCINFLEEKRWRGTPRCTYCESTNITPLPREHRHHCNTCNTTFSVTVRTIFHRTHLPFQKWFLAVSLVLNARKGMSARQLSRDLEVTKDTAWSMAMRIRQAMVVDRDLLIGIVEMNEAYIGGKACKGSGGPHKRGRGTKKTPTIGMIENGGHVRIQTVIKPTDKVLSSFLREIVDLTTCNRIITDQYGEYHHFSDLVNTELSIIRFGIPTEKISLTPLKASGLFSSVVSTANTTKSHFGTCPDTLTNFVIDSITAKARTCLKQPLPEP